jgi:copper chaperone CopZ
MKETFHLQNVRGQGCVYNIQAALEMIEGVRAVQVHREELLVDVLYELPATPYQMREQLLSANYLSEAR